MPRPSRKAWVVSCPHSSQPGLIELDSDCSDEHYVGAPLV